MRSYYSSELKNKKGNIKSTWNSINHLIGKHPKNRCYHIQDAQNNQIDAEDIPNAFNKYFTEIGNLLSNQIPNTKYSLNITLPRSVIISCSRKFRVGIF